MSQAISPKALKTILASTALIGLIASLAIRHADHDDGLSAQDITEADLETASALGVSTGALLVDFVEPEDGEGGSERAIKRAAVEMSGGEKTPAPDKSLGHVPKTAQLPIVHGRNMKGSR